MPQEPLPKIEIKGFASDLQRFRTSLETTREAFAKLHETRGGFHQDLVDAEAQFTSLRQDIRFELMSLGNAGGGSDQQSEKQVVTAKDVGDAAPLPDGSTAPAEPEH